MIAATFRPIQQWSKPARRYTESSRFRASYPSTLDKLEHELNQLGAREIVIQIDLDARDIRNDGWPKASARPRSSRVRLSFEVALRGKEWQTLNYEADLYDQWQDNLRAIALMLEDQRAIRRHGVGSVQQIYTGYAALPPPGGTTQNAGQAMHGTLTTDEAAAVLARHSKFQPASILADAGVFDAARRRALEAVHPDRGGSTTEFQAVQDACRLLAAHFGRRE